MSSHEPPTGSGQIATLRGFGFFRNKKRWPWLVDAMVEGDGDFSARVSRIAPRLGGPKPLLYLTSRGRTFKATPRQLEIKNAVVIPSARRAERVENWLQLKREAAARLKRSAAARQREEEEARRLAERLRLDREAEKAQGLVERDRERARAQAAERENRKQAAEAREPEEARPRAEIRARQALVAKTRVADTSGDVGLPASTAGTSRGTATLPDPGHAYFDLIVFDLDRTLVDTRHLAKFRGEGNLHAWPEDRERRLRHAVNAHRKVLIKPSDIMSVLRAYPNMRFGVVTKAPRRYAQIVLQELYPQLLDCVPLVAFEDVQKQKPAPDGVLACMRAAGVNADRTCYVGDDDLDIRAAYGAGCLAVLSERGWPSMNSAEYRARDLLPDAKLKTLCDLVGELPCHLPSLDAPVGASTRSHRRKLFPANYVPGGDVPFRHAQVFGRYFSSSCPRASRHQLTRLLLRSRRTGSWEAAARDRFAQLICDKTASSHRPRLITVIPSCSAPRSCSRQRAAAPRTRDHPRHELGTTPRWGGIPGSNARCLGTSAERGRWPTGSCSWWRSKR